MTAVTTTATSSAGLSTTVTPRRLVVVLGWIIALLAAVAAGVGLFANGGPGSVPVTSLRGRPTDLYGVGLYRFDSVLVGVGNRGTDAVTLFLEVPALVVALGLYRRRSLRGAIVLIGVLGWMLYYYASMALNTAFNALFPVYVLLFAASLFAVPLALGSVDRERFALQFPDTPSRRALIGYLGGLATVLTLAWAPAMIGSAVTGVLPARLGAYTTEVTWALDLGVVVPAVAATAVLLWARAPLGPLAAAAMLSLNVALGVALVGQGVAQLLADVPMSNGERVGAMASFALMTVIAGVLLGRLLRHLRPPAATAPRPRRR
jgi:hypothetical protein